MAIQEEPNGTGDAVRSAADQIGADDTVLVLYGDVPLITAASVLDRATGVSIPSSTRPIAAGSMTGRAAFPPAAVSALRRRAVPDVPDVGAGLAGLGLRVPCLRGGELGGFAGGRFLDACEGILGRFVRALGHGLLVLRRVSLPGWRRAVESGRVSCARPGSVTPARARGNPRR